MNLPLTAVDLAGSVALLLWSIHMVRTGIQRAFGARLHTFLTWALRSRFEAFLAGLGVTAVMQSSTATGLMLTSFAAGGLVDLVPGLAVMLGANVGTTLIVQLVSFDVAEAAPALILVGFVMFQKATAGRRSFGRVLIGLGLLLSALHHFVALLQPYEQQPDLRTLLGAVSAEPILDVLLAAGFTWAAHSSAAVVLLAMSFAASGVVPPGTAFTLVLGANLGTAINPMIEGGAGKDTAAHRLPVGNFLNRVVGVAVVLPLLPWLGPKLAAIEPGNARAVADFHTAFNVVTALVFFPILRPYAAVLKRLLPSRAGQDDPAGPMHLDASARDTPIVAIGAATREALRMADMLEARLQAFRKALARSDRHLIGENKGSTEIFDKLAGAIRAYLVSVEEEAMSEKDSRRAMEILSFVTNFEQAGDIVDRNLCGALSRALKRNLAFPEDGRAELLDITDRLLANVRQAASLIVTEDVRAARLLANEKQQFRDIENKAGTAHFARTKRGQPGSEGVPALHLNLLRDIKAVNSHLVAAAAYPILERSEEPPPDRPRAGDGS